MSSGSEPFSEKSSFGCQRLLEGLPCISFAPDSAPECQAWWRVEQFGDLLPNKQGIGAWICSALTRDRVVHPAVWTCSDFQRWPNCQGECNHHYIAFSLLGQETKEQITCTCTLVYRSILRFPEGLSCITRDSHLFVVKKFFKKRYEVAYDGKETAQARAELYKNTIANMVRLQCFKVPGPQLVNSKEIYKAKCLFIAIGWCHSGSFLSFFLSFILPFFYFFLTLFTLCFTFWWPFFSPYFILPFSLFHLIFSFFLLLFSLLVFLSFVSFCPILSQ